MHEHIAMVHKCNVKSSCQKTGNNVGRSVRIYICPPIEKIGGGLVGVENDNRLSGNVEIYDRA
jgi:hypothetical protein